MTTGMDVNVVFAGALLALGVAAPVPAFSGGLMLALGCCYAVRAHKHVEARKSLGLSLFSAVLAAMLVAGLKDQTARVWVWGGLPLQIQMAAAGLLSQGVFELVAARSGHVLARLADRAGLSGGEK